MRYTAAMSAGPDQALRGRSDQTSRCLREGAARGMEMAAGGREVVRLRGRLSLRRRRDERRVAHPISRGGGEAGNPGIDQDRWAQVFDYHYAKIELALAAVDVMRAHTVNLLGSCRRRPGPPRVRTRKPADTRRKTGWRFTPSTWRNTPGRSSARSKRGGRSRPTELSRAAPAREGGNHRAERFQGIPAETERARSRRGRHHRRGDRESRHVDRGRPDQPGHRPDAAGRRLAQRPHRPGIGARSEDGQAVRDRRSRTAISSGRSWTS